MFIQLTATITRLVTYNWDLKSGVIHAESIGYISADHHELGILFLTNQCITELTRQDICEGQRVWNTAQLGGL